MVRRAAALALLLLLAACGRGGERAPFTDSRLPPGLAQSGWPPAGWTWGLIQIRHDPPQRYGVAPASDIARAQLLILPGYGGVAEESFAAASDFTARGCLVWVLEGQGQGGSGRYVTPRDLGYVRSFDGDVGAIRQMVVAAIAPTPAAPLVAIADGTAAPEALRAAQEGLPAVTALILTNPRFWPPGPPTDPSKARWRARLGFGAVRAAGQTAWRRDATDPNAVRHDWQVANPDLRMGGPSYAWIAAFDDLVAQLQSSDLRRVSLPVLMLETGRPDPVAEHLCRLMPRCRIQAATDLHAAEVVAIEAQLPATSLSNPDPGR
jgi:lysophospholipase